MINFFKLLVFLLVLFIRPVKACEFEKINNIFDLLENKYIESINFKNISISSAKLLAQFDEDFKVYNSDSKVYVYKRNSLIGFTHLTQDNDFNSWHKSLINLLKASINNSEKISNNISEIEDGIIEILSNNMDNYSRIKTIKNNISNSISYKIENNILYIEPKEFFIGFTDLLSTLIKDNNTIDGVILDLRKNKGGVFDEALKTADLFLDDGVIAYSKFQKNNIKYYNATKGDILNGRQIVILTSGHTASSAEVVTAALSEQSRAITIGTKTFGKGSLQNIYNIDDKSLYITSGRFYSPSGKTIEKNGINPQICNGLENSCEISDEKNPSKDILLAISLIKRNLG